MAWRSQQVYLGWHSPATHLLLQRPRRKCAWLLGCQCQCQCQSACPWHWQLPSLTSDAMSRFVHYAWTPSPIAVPHEAWFNQYEAASLRLEESIKPRLNLPAVLLPNPCRGNGEGWGVGRRRLARRSSGIGV